MEGPHTTEIPEERSQGINVLLYYLWPTSPDIFFSLFSDMWSLRILIHDILPLIGRSGIAVILTVSKNGVTRDM